MVWKEGKETMIISPAGGKFSRVKIGGNEKNKLSQIVVFLSCSGNLIELFGCETSCLVKICI